MEQFLKLQRLVLTMGEDREKDYFTNPVRSIYGHNMSFDLRDGLPLMTTNQLDLGKVLEELFKEFKLPNNILNRIELLSNNYRGFYQNNPYKESLVFNFNKSDITDEELLNTIAEEYRSKLPRTLSKEEFNKRLPKQYLDIKVFQSSGDAFKNIPFYVAYYSVLLSVIAERSNMIPRFLLWSGGHVIVDKINLSAIDIQITRTPYPSPKLIINSNVKLPSDYTFDDFKLYGYESHKPLLVNSDQPKTRETTV